MQKQTKFILFIVSVIIIVGGLGIYFSFKPEKPSKLDEFAQCLTSSGSKFYGAFWCAHCQDQKKDFGSSQKYIPYVECSTLDGQNQQQICKDAGIDGYPTWTFVDGSRLTGKQPLEILADKTQCILPQ